MRVGDKDYNIMSEMFIYSPCDRCCAKYDVILLPVEELWESQQYLKDVRKNPDVYLEEWK